MADQTPPPPAFKRRLVIVWSEKCPFCGQRIAGLTEQEARDTYERHRQAQHADRTTTK